MKDVRAQRIWRMGERVMRTEHDSIGSVNLPDDAYYGVQSLRAKENFPMTGRLLHPYMMDSLVVIKKAAAMANLHAGELKQEVASAIIRACDEILSGKLRDQFIVDPIQGGAGTSANMNANEVIANRATEILDCFVNVGGASVNSGTSAYTLDFPNGLVVDPPRIPTTPNRGLMYEYVARGVPVVNMLNVRQMAADNGLPYDPVPLTQPGEGGVYFDIVYPTWIAALAAILMLVVLAFGRARGGALWRAKPKAAA